MLLTADQLAEFKAEGSLLIRSLIPDAVLAGWRKQFAAAAAAHEPPVDLAEPSTWPPGRLEAAWPELDPGLYDLPELQELVQQLGGGAFAPTSQAGRPWAPQQPMTRVVLPEAPGTEWAPPADGHLDGYGGGGWGGGFMAFFVRQPPPPSPFPPPSACLSPHPTRSHLGDGRQAVLLEDTDSPQGGGTAYWPRSHLANHRYFLRHPERIDGSYLFEEPVKSRGHVGLLDDPSVGEVTCVTGKAGDAMLFHGLTTHNNSTSRAGGTQPRVALFARYASVPSRLPARLALGLVAV